MPVTLSLYLGSLNRFMFIPEAIRHARENGQIACLSVSVYAFFYLRSFISSANATHSY